MNSSDSFQGKVSVHHESRRITSFERALVGGTLDDSCWSFVGEEEEYMIISSVCGLS